VFLLGAGVWIAWGLPEISLDRPANGQPMIILEAADGSPITKSGGTSGLPVVREELPAHLVGAVLAIEDRRFFDHNGVDLFGVLRAAYRNFHAGGIVEGGSTITQQLAKVLFLNREQTLRRKLQEAAIATLLELRLSKDEILTKYLDSIYFGAGATGVSAAARVYFDKPVSELTLAESAMLAGLIQAPSKLNPMTNLKAARERATVVLQAMVTTGFVTREEAISAALNSAAPVRGSSVAQTGSWFGDWVYTDAMSRMGPLAGEARIRTTLRPELQSLAETVVQNGLSRAGAATRVGQAALVAMTMDGAVVAMVGGRSYNDSQFNRAARAQRQPGSAFKTFVYLAALQAGWSPDDIVLDTPIEINGWKPQNYSGGFQGKVTLEQAFARSLNAPTVRLAQDVGIDKVIAVARDLGIDGELQPNLSLSLGTSELTLLDITGAYAAIASDRVRCSPGESPGSPATPAPSRPSSPRRRKRAKRSPSATR
jgi:membrane peptidoglycan carboxypeptidase